MTFSPNPLVRCTSIIPVRIVSNDRLWPLLSPFSSQSNACVHTVWLLPVFLTGLPIPPRYVQGACPSGMAESTASRACMRYLVLFSFKGALQPTLQACLASSRQRVHSGKHPVIRFVWPSTPLFQLGFALSGCHVQQLPNSAMYSPLPRASHYKL